MLKVFVDGNRGTTGLNVSERLAQRSDVTLLTIDPEKRKDPAERKRLINSADIVFLCLPDDAAREAVAMIENPAVRVIDASTAHRTALGWAYGLPELSPEHRQAIERGRRVAVPGCHASGFAMLAYPLMAMGYTDGAYPFTIFSVTGFTGGGSKMIAEYGDVMRPTDYETPRQYALTQNHKHLPEMRVVNGLSQYPAFSPVVGDFPRGMVVTVPLYAKLFRRPASVSTLREDFAEYYAGQRMVRVLGAAEVNALDGYLGANKLAGHDSAEIIVTGNDERIMLHARFDNLGKGASGAAMQCMNIMTGAPETEGLTI
ncbi:MAG: N-acetyl-gamma-glutamyl-phosphate reductase [Clostridiales bacterium]|nr:N-acetyl-gamma-glutamyl-phosphate reductase [Clostridiales bacterium]